MLGPGRSYFDSVVQKNYCSVHTNLIIFFLFLYLFTFYAAIPNFPLLRARDEKTEFCEQRFSMYHLEPAALSGVATYGRENCQDLISSFRLD